MKNFFLYFTIWISLSPLTAYSFTSLKDARIYAKSVEEYPEIDNDNWLNPLFTSFEESLVPNIFSRTLTRFGLKKPLWSPSDLKDLIVQVTKHRELNGDVGRFIQIKETKVDESFFIWGDLHGAFHSLVRDLDYLETEGVIDNAFKIKSETDYLIFNGNAIDQSPFSMETLTLLLNLMAANPQRVYYVRGSHEDKQKWHDQNLGFSLNTRAFFVSNEQIPLDTEITNFFNSLPLALYLKGVGPQEKISFVRISPSNRQNSEINEQKIGGYFESSLLGKNNIHLNDRESKVAEKPLSMVAIIKDEDRTDKFTQTTGLALHEPEEGAISWSVLSASSGAYRRTFDFFFDAFAVVRTAKNIADWTISLYNRDVREKSGFNLSKVYTLSSGTLLKELKTAPEDLLHVTKDLRTTENAVQKLESSIADIKKEISKIKENGVSPTKKVIVEPKQESSVALVPDKTVMATKFPVTQKMLTFGSTMDLSKGGRPTGMQMKASVEALLSDVQKEGKGIDGLVPKVIFSDDEYTPEKARENILRFINQGIDKVILCWGAPTIEKYLDLVREKKIAVFFPSTGASVLRNPELINVINFRRSYADEARIMATYAIDKKKSKKIVIFYQNDAFGKTALDGAIKVAQEKKIDYQKEWVLVPYERNDLNLTEQAGKIKDADPEAIFFFSIDNITKELIRILGVSFFEQKQLFALSSSGEKEFTDYLAQKGLKCIIASAFPNLVTSELEIAKECREVMKKNNIDLDVWAFEGYVSISLMLDALKKIDGPITNESIIKQFEGMKNVNYKGLELNFNPNTRELSKYIWLNEGDPEWIKYGIEKPEEKEIQTDKTASAPKIPVTQKMLTFGSTLDLSKGERYSGTQLKASVLGLLKENGGNEIGGVTPKVLFVDDEYTPEKARENILRFIEQGIDKTIVSMGTPTLEKYLDLVKEKKVGVFFPSTGASIFRKPDLTYFIHFRKSYADEAKLAMTYALDTLRVKKIVILYQNDSYGLGALEGPMQLAKERNIDYQKEWVLIPYERADLNVGDQIARVKEVDPDAILFIAVVSIAKEFMKSLGVPYLAQKKLLALSDFAEKEFSDYAKEKGLQFITMNVFPNSEQSTMQIAKEFREMVRKQHVDLDAYAFEGYIAMELMLDCLKKIQGDITIEAIVKQFESYKNYNFKGLELNFNPETRELSKYIWINDGDPEWKQFAIEKQDKKEKIAQEQKPTQIEKPAAKPEVQPESKAANSVKTTEAILTFGSSLDLSKGERFSGQELKEGMSLYLRKMREEGDTIQGVIPKIIFLDDEYTPEHARANALHFLKDGVDKMVGSSGSATLAAYLDLVKEKKIGVFFPATGAPIFRNPELKYLVNFRNSNPQEAKVALEYALDVDKAKKLAFFVQNDAFGKGAFEGAKLVAKSRNIDYEKDWKIVYCERVAVDLTEQARDIKAYDPDAIVFLAIPTQGKELIRLLGPSYLIDKKMLAISDYGQSAFKEFVREKGLRVLITNIVPNPNGLTIPIVNEFREYAKKNNVVPDTDTLEAYLSTAVLMDTIKKIKGEITVESIIAQLEQIKDYNFKGLLLNFNKETRELMTHIWVDTITADWKEMAVQN